MGGTKTVFIITKVYMVVPQASFNHHHFNGFEVDARLQAGKVDARWQRFSIKSKLV